MSSSVKELGSEAPVLRPSNIFNANNDKKKVPAVAFLPGDRHIITCYGDDYLQVIEIGTSKPVGGPWRDVAESSQICTFAVSPDGKSVATGSKDGKIRLWTWNGKTAKFVTKSTGHTAAANCLRWNPHDGGAHIASGFDDGRVAVWPVPGLKNPISTHEACLRHIYAIDYSRDGTQIIASGYDCKFSVLRVNERAKVIGLDKICEVCSNPHHVLSVTSARTTDRHVIVTGSTDGKIRVRPSENCTYELEFEGHSDIVCAVVPSPGNDILASASYDRTLRLWNLKARRKIGRLEHSAGVSCAAFAGGGALLATGTCDGKIYVWEITDLLQHDTNLNVHDNEANNEGVNIKPLDVGVIDSTIPTPANHPASRYGNGFWGSDIPTPNPSPTAEVTKPNDHVSDTIRTRRLLPRYVNRAQVAAARIRKSLKVTRTRELPDVPIYTPGTIINRRRFRTSLRQQSIPLDPIAQPSMLTVPELAGQTAEGISPRSISGLRLKSTLWNKMLYRVGCIAVEDD